jgi:methylated-DNA-[protein]-cysteine S-methyltransferase
LDLQDQKAIFWSLLTYKGWNIYLAATKKGLCYVGSQSKPFEELKAWSNRRFHGFPLAENNEMLQPYIDELIEYLEGKRKCFTVSIDYKATDFQLEVCNALLEIPFGQTRSYSDIANYINKPTAVRAVGTAIGANPLLIAIPCHRVLGKNGSLTGYRGGLEMKTQLLDLELQTSETHSELTT